MIYRKKSYQNLSDYIQFIFKKIEFSKKRDYFSEKIINLGNFNYDYADLFLGKNL